MLGSLQDAEDAVQEALLRSWRAIGGFEGRSSVRSWLYSIATNVALDAASHRSRRELPVDFGPAAGLGSDLDPPLTDGELAGAVSGPVAAVGRRALPGSQVRAARERGACLRGRAAAPGAAAAGSHCCCGRSPGSRPPRSPSSWARRRRRQQRAAARPGATRNRLPAKSQQATLRELGDEHVRALAERYADALERGDADTLVSMLTADATWSMPPIPDLVRRPGRRPGVPRSATHCANAGSTCPLRRTGSSRSAAISSTRRRRLRSGRHRRAHAGGRQDQRGDRVPRRGGSVRPVRAADRAARGRGVGQDPGCGRRAGRGAVAVVEVEHADMQDGSLLQRRPQRAVQAVLQVELPVPADDVREQVAVEGGVGGQHAVQVQHVLGGDELVQPDWPGRYLRPFPAGPCVIGVWPPVPDLLEDHSASLEETGPAPPGPAERRGARLACPAAACPWQHRGMPDRRRARR